MFTFAYPGLLLLLLLVPVFILLYAWMRYARKRKLARFGKMDSLRDLMPEVSPYKPPVKLTLRMLALAMIIIAVARPWGGVSSQETTREGIEVVIAVDASNSMLASATDREDGVDRTRTAKLVLEKLINRLNNDRVGLIAYAGDAYTLIPVTNDYVSAKTFLNSIDPSQIPHQGTNIAAAVEQADLSFSRGKDIGKAIVLITDAEDLEDRDGVMKSVAAANKKGIQVNVLGVGSSVPVTIPEGNGKMIDPETGEPVKTALNEDLAIEIAKAGGGIYVNASNKDAIDELEKQMDKQKKMALESSFSVMHDELFVIFVWIALALIVADLLLSDSKTAWLDRFTFFRKSAPVAICLLLAAGISACDTPDLEQAAGEGKAAGSSGAAVSKSVAERAASGAGIDSIQPENPLEGCTPKERELILSGNKLYYNGDPRQALADYQKAAKVNPKSLIAAFNSGVCDVRIAYDLQQKAIEANEPQRDSTEIKKHMEQAVDLFTSVAQARIRTDNLSSKAFYNLGNILFVDEQYGQAIELYKNALRLNPADDSARRNLRIAQLKQQENQQNQQNQENQQDQQDNQDQQNNQNNQDNQNQQNQQNPPQQQNINNQTSEQILNAAERKENETRMRRKLDDKKDSESSGRSTKRW